MRQVLSSCSRCKAGERVNELLVDILHRASTSSLLKVGAASVVWSRRNQHSMANNGVLFVQKYILLFRNGFNCARCRVFNRLPRENALLTNQQSMNRALKREEDRHDAKPTYTHQRRECYTCARGQQTRNHERNCEVFISDVRQQTRRSMLGYIRRAEWSGAPSGCDSGLLASREAHPRFVANANTVHRFKLSSILRG